MERRPTSCVGRTGTSPRYSPALTSSSSISATRRTNPNERPDDHPDPLEGRRGGFAGGALLRAPQRRRRGRLRLRAGATRPEACRGRLIDGDTDGDGDRQRHRRPGEDRFEGAAVDAEHGDGFTRILTSLVKTHDEPPH